MNLIPFRGETEEPGSPDAKFRIMRRFKNNQRSTSYAKEEHIDTTLLQIGNS